MVMTRMHETRMCVTRGMEELGSQQDANQIQAQTSARTAELHKSGGGDLQWLWDMALRQQQ